MDLRDEPFLSLQGCWHCHCSPCQMQVPKLTVPGCHLRAVFSALGVLLQAAVEACGDSDLNFKLQRGDSCPWDMCFVTSATSAVPFAPLLGTVRSYSDWSYCLDQFWSRIHRGGES